MIYLDNASTTKPFLEVCDIVYENMKVGFGNPSSVHKIGRNSLDLILESKKIIAKKISASPSEIIFTSGATESINTAIFGTLGKLAKRGNHIITTEIEHSATLSSMHELKLRGFEIDYIKPDINGHINVMEFEKLVREDTILASIIMVSNEIGSLQNIKKLNEVFKKKTKFGFFHTDAVQGFCKIDINVSDLGIDLMSVSGHKVHGPKGIGALYIRENTNIKPLIFGGSQQSDYRAGTENVSGILGFAKAVEIYDEKCDKTHISSLNAYLKETLVGNFSKYGVQFNGSDDVKNIVNFSIPKIKSEVALRVLESHEIYVSASSACNKGKLSHIVKALGLPNHIVDSALRVSFYTENTTNDIDKLIDALKICVQMFE